MKTEKKLLITKASGEQVPFSSQKLEQSLLRSGADTQAVNTVIEDLKPYLHEGISTRKIYKHAFALLRRVSKPYAGRYKLKRAIMELGPTGFPFEQFIAEILHFQGFTVQVGVLTKGHCVTHEIDVVAVRGEQQNMIECKFHNMQGIPCDVKIPLYIHARFQDIEKLESNKPGNDIIKFHEGWVVTNTKFTGDAIQYGTCAGLHLLGWDYPRKGSLNELIDASGLYPLTCMTTLTSAEKKYLLNQKIVLCRDVNRRPDLLDALELTPARRKKILQESYDLCARVKEVVAQ